MKLEALKNKKILIVGKGVEGESVFRFLKKHVPQSTIVIVDQKDGKDYLDGQKEFDIAIKSPGVKSELLTIPFTTATNIFFENAKGKVIGITGTKGKSTTASLIYEMLKKEGLDVYLGGNIGLAMLDFLDTVTDQSWSVLELSSFQLQDIKKSPHIAVMLMVVSEHLDYHTTIEKYVNAKRNILHFQTPQDFAVINRDYPASNESDIHIGGKVLSVSREREVEDGSFIREDVVWFRKGSREEKVIDVDQITLLGKHNLENVCAAIVAAKLAGVSTSSIRSVLRSFKGLEHRLEFVGEVGGVRFYNDSLSTIPQATIEAVEALGADVETLIVGGYDRGLDFSELGRYLSSGQIKTLIIFSPSGERIWEAISEETIPSLRPEKFEAHSMKDAVRIANAETSSGKICLLSPASASFGIFKDYKDRGEQFKKEVQRLQSRV